LLGVEGNQFVKDGCWDSIHIVEATEESATKATYKLTTTVILHMGVEREEVGSTTLSGTLTRQVISTEQAMLHHILEGFFVALLMSVGLISDHSCPLSVECMFIIYVMSTTLCCML
jgi:F-actin capping protein, beta subunit